MLLSTREKEIIELLIKYHGQYVTIYDIAQQLAVSSRTIHRELKHVESYIDTFSIELERVNKKGIRLKGLNQDIQALKLEMTQQQTRSIYPLKSKKLLFYMHLYNLSMLLNSIALHKKLAYPFSH